MRRGGSRRILLSFPTCCARIEWWIGSTSPIGRRSLRPSSQSALLSSRCLSSRSLGGHYCAGLDRSLNARVRLSEQTARHSSAYVRQEFTGVGCGVVLCALPSLPRIVWIIIVDLPTGFNHEQKNSNANPGYHCEHDKKYFHDVCSP